MARRISQSRHWASPRFRCGLPHLRISSHFPHRASSITTEDPHPPVQIFWGEEYIIFPPPKEPSLNHAKKGFHGWRQDEVVWQLSAQGVFLLALSSLGYQRPKHLSSIAYLQGIYNHPNIKTKNRVSLLRCSPIRWLDSRGPFFMSEDTALVSFPRKPRKTVGKFPPLQQK